MFAGLVAVVVGATVGVGCLEASLAASSAIPPGCVVVRVDSWLANHSSCVMPAGGCCCWFC